MRCVLNDNIQISGYISKTNVDLPQTYGLPNVHILVTNV